MPAAATAAAPVPSEQVTVETANEAEELGLATGDAPVPAPRKESSNEQYEKVAGKWWPWFCRTQGWDPIKMKQWLDEDGEPIPSRIQPFFVKCYDNWHQHKGSKDKARDPDFMVTAATWKTLISWAAAELNGQRAARPKSQLKGYIQSLPGIAERDTAIKANKRSFGMDHKLDIQAEIESDIGKEKMLEMVSCCLKVKVPSTSPLYALQCNVELRVTHQQGSRHDDLRSEKFAHMFARDNASIGQKGMPVLCNVRDGGKTNSNGRITYSGVLQHKNPLLCSIFARGVFFLFRWKVDGAKFPDVLDADDLFKRCTLRSAADEFSNVSYKASAEVMKRLYKEVGVYATKIMHQGRGELQRALDDLGVDLTDIQRLCDYIHDDCHESYLLNLPIPALLAAAGYDHEHPRSAFAAHLSVPVPPELLDLLCPEMKELKKRIDTAFDQALRGVDAKKERLFCARGCWRALKLIFETVISCAAARPRDADGHILADESPIYKLFFATNRVFQLPFFSDSKFLEFAGQVKAAEDRELDGVSDGAGRFFESFAELSPYLSDKFKRELEPVKRGIAELLTSQRTASPLEPAVAASAAEVLSAEDSTKPNGKKPRGSMHQAAAETQAMRRDRAEIAPRSRVR